MLELIKAELKKQGLPEDLAGQINAQSEAEIEGAVAEFKKTYTPPRKSLSELLSESGMDQDFVTEVSKQVQSEVDRRVTQALKTFEEKMKPSGDPPKKTDGDPVISELKQMISALTEQVTNQQAHIKQQSLQSKAREALISSGLPESWVSRVNVAKEEEIETAVTSLKDEYASLKQGIIDQAIKDSDIPGQAFGKTKIDSKVIDDYVSNSNIEKGAQKVQKLD
jgi:hypothetical protein